MRAFHVVVATIQSISPEYPDIALPPADLFDLVLVDEAHHSPARTWQAVLDHFGTTKRLLFSATPWRQDQREIKGRFIFTYDLRKAFQDGVFGEIRFDAVDPAPGQNHDIAIAQAAERKYRADRLVPFNHRVMVRTDSRKRAIELNEIYLRHTNLKLKIVTGDKSLRYVQGVIDQLSSGDLDGIICVNMLGEGFNFPSLKIAAIHSPHRSLSVTLQFIGRFARTTGEYLGPATFLAIPSDIEIQAERLYDSRAVWQDIVQNLSATRVHQEAQTREVLESFEATSLVTQDLADLSLYVLEPYYHVKLYQLDAAVDLRAPVEFPELLQAVYQAISEPHNAVIYVTREVSLPRWTTDDRLSSVQPDLFILYQHLPSNLLFICASRRTEGIYQFLSQSFADANPKTLPLVRLNRALNKIEAPEFFNVGMRNRVASNTTESYRILAGSNADKGIAKSDGRLFHRGHAFGRGSDEGELVTIGLSSASKIWSNKSGKLPDLIAWCQKLAIKISGNRASATGSGLDHLDAGEEIETLPPGVIAVDWRHSVYKTAPPIVRYQGPRGEVVAQLLDFDLSIDQALSTNDAVVIELRHEHDFVFRACFSFESDRFFEPRTANEPSATIERDRHSIDLVDFLNSEMPVFYTGDLSLVDGYSLLKAPTEDRSPFDDSQIDALDWDGLNVDIEREFGQARSGKISIHDGVEANLISSPCSVVYYDHGTGELADFVAVEQVHDGLAIRFYHCKGSAEANPGHRLQDVYEVASQVVKSVPLALKQRVASRIRRRFTQRVGSHRFIKGDLTLLERLLDETPAAQIQFEFIAVQPGLRKRGLPIEYSNLLAAANDHLVRGGFMPLRIQASP